jgi:single-stranded DNA-binding protein
VNRTCLSGRFASETAFDQRGASFVVEVARPDGNEDLFRVRCAGEAERILREKAAARVMLGLEVLLSGSLRQEEWLDDSGQSRKSVFVIADWIEFR